MLSKEVSSSILKVFGITLLVDWTQIFRTIGEHSAHKAHEKYLDDSKIEVLVYLAQRPDQNLIKNEWLYLKKIVVRTSTNLEVLEGIV